MIMAGRSYVQVHHEVSKPIYTEHGWVGITQNASDGVLTCRGGDEPYPLVGLPLLPQLGLREVLPIPTLGELFRPLPVGGDDLA